MPPIGLRPIIPDRSGNDRASDRHKDDPIDYDSPEAVEAREAALDTALDEVIRRAIQSTRVELPETPALEDLPETPALEAWLNEDRPRFPLHVFPPLIRRYVEVHAKSIHCPTDLLAVPLLAIAGAAIGRAGRRLRVKPGWDVSSCLWSACLCPSSSGKTPALNAVQNFYDDRQDVENAAWQAERQAHADDEANPKPGPHPTLMLTDTTVESLRDDLASGAVLFIRDELGAWCHQMGQYKQGNADRFDWCSFWSHSPVMIGRKTERVWVKDPFVAVTGMMVPASARELNYRGNSDDGFVHRMLLAFPEAMRPVATLEGVPEELTCEYKEAMARLFDCPHGDEAEVLTFDPAALAMLMRWANVELYRDLLPEGSPDWLISKHRKLFDNCLRLCLVLHELWKVADDGETDEDDDDYWLSRRDYEGRRVPLRPGVVDLPTAERAVAVVEYFRGHIPAMLSVMGDMIDDVDRAHARLSPRGKLTTREVIHSTTYKTKDKVLALFTEWARRGYGKTVHGRQGSMAFHFNGFEETG